VRLRYTQRARQDIERIFAHLDTRSPAGAMSVKHALKRAIETIDAFPTGGQASEWKNARQRPVNPYPYIVYWTVEDSEIWILHIRHTSRQAPGQDAS
jgi:plasmid stabilization system protein ParE